MYTAVILGVLIAAVSAGQRSIVMLGKPMPPQTKLDQPEPRRCCAEPYYTYEEDSVINSMDEEGSLLTELEHSRGAYDSIEKKIGLEIDLHFSNGTVDIFKVIADYKEGKGYIAYTDEGERKCFQFHITSGFPYNCLPDESKYVGSVTIGDRALIAESWYYNDQFNPDDDDHIVYSVKKPECIDLGYVSREFDPTGNEIRTDSTTNSDYSLGICDPDKWFKPPPECEPEKVVNVDSIPKNVVGRRGPGGKRLFQ